MTTKINRTKSAPVLSKVVNPQLLFGDSFFQISPFFGNIFYLTSMKPNPSAGRE